jgi:hypothetical protein
VRSDERFVIEALASKYEGKWRPGEDPPDAYLEFKGQWHPVEITTLVELVRGDDGKLLSRMSQDEAAIAMADAMDAKLNKLFGGTRAVLLIISAPLRRQASLRKVLEAELQRIAFLQQLPDEPIGLAWEGNDVLISVNDEWEPGQKRVIAAVLNERASPDIFANALAALSERLAAKRSWANSVRGAWLALFNRYDLLADADTYRHALNGLLINHSFARIVIVSTSGKVDLLFSR